MHAFPDLPKFLRVKGPSKFKKVELKPSPKGDIIDERFACVAPETVAMIQKEMRSGRFRAHWLDDPTTLLIFERDHLVRRERAEKRAEDAKVERKIGKVAKPEWGADQKIVVLIREPRRQAGAARIPRFASLLEYLDKNPSASVIEVFSNTTYIKADLIRDIRLKIVKTDIISKPKEEPKGIIDLRDLKKEAPKAAEPEKVPEQRLKDGKAQLRKAKAAKKKGKK